MAIIQSCCCWRSVRRGSFACAIYSGIYYLSILGVMGGMLYENSQYLSGKRALPESRSLLETTITKVSIIFAIVFMIISCFGLFSCLLLVYGLLMDRRLLLLPWIFIALASILVDISHFIFTATCTRPAFHPAVAMMLTLAFFLLCLNLYTVLCVISQFQEYSAGRGRATDDSEYRVPAIRYSAQPTTTATSCLSSRRITTNNDTKATVTATPTQSPTAIITNLTAERSPTVGRHARKHVQFPDIPSVIQGEKLDAQAVNPMATRCTLETEVRGTQLNP